VAKLTSAISSSPSVTVCDGEKFNFCGVSAAGTADAEAPPASEKVKPAAPKAGIVAFATLFRFEACFTRDIVASSIPVRVISIPALPILRCAVKSRKLLKLTNALFRIQFPFILMNDIDVSCAMLTKLKLRVAFASRKQSRRVRCKSGVQ
jgi:hypothetical protein